MTYSQDRIPWSMAHRIEWFALHEMVMASAAPKPMPVRVTSRVFTVKCMGSLLVSGLVRRAHRHRRFQSLHDDAVTLGELQQLGELVGRRRSFERDFQADGLEADRRIPRDT